MGGLILGSIVGALTALILAPQSGETRKLIRDKAIELGKEISDRQRNLKRERQRASDPGGH